MAQSKMTKRQATGGTDLLSRFGLRERPFTKEIRPRDHFHLEEHEQVLRAVHGIIQARGLAAIEGPAGCGKTALCRRFVEELPEARYEVRYLLASGLGVRDACRELSVALDLNPSGTRPALLQRIKEALVRRPDERGVHPVILLDDAHELTVEVLGLIKTLTNFSMDSRLVVSVILIGQPILRRLLRHVDLEDVAGRLGVVATLGNLSREATVRYVQHRITVAGGKRVPFDTNALEALFELTCGNLRAIDHVAIRSLELADEASAEVVDASFVRAAGRWVCA
jgi:general secretion pathway protein A